MIDREVNKPSHNNNSQLMINIPSSAFGSLRKELINTLGIERAKGFLLRYGWDCGVTDSLQIKDIKWEDPKDILLEGPKMHMENSRIQIESTVCEVDFDEGTLHFEGIWKNSHEAIEHIKLFGYSIEPVCHSLVGCASGYLSTVMGKKVIAIETECIAMGHEHCHWICKTVEEWDGNPVIAKELTFYEEDQINHELEETYEQLRIERDNLSKTHDVHLKLYKEVIYETGLQPIAQRLYETMNTPVMIESHQFEPKAVEGISIQEAENYSQELKEWIKHEQRKGDGKKEIDQVVLLDISPGHKRVIAPIYFRQKIHGYCSYFTEKSKVSEAEKMVLGQVALASALHLLNERTRFTTEQRIRGSFLDDILNKRMTMAEIAGRAHYFNFELNDPYFMMNIHRDFSGSSAEEEIEFNDQFMSDLSKFFQSKGIKCLLGKKSEDFIILFSEYNLSKSHLKKNRFCREVLDYCSEKYPELTFKMGVSSNCSSLEDVSRLYNECMAALKVDDHQQNLVFFDSLGIVGMLFQMKNSATIEDFASKVLGSLIEEDKGKNIELTKTLHFYIANGCSVKKTARAMNFSINGLRYRLAKINDILQVDINQDYNRYEIYLALQCLIVLGELEI